MATGVDTGKIVGRRIVKFDSIDDCLDDIDQVVTADQEGRLRAVGNWTPGQAMAHVASWIEYGYDGYPIKSPPFLIRWILRLQLKKMLDQGMDPGVRIPGIKAGTVGMDEMETRAAAERLKAAFLRLKNGEEAHYHSPAFGKMSHADRIALNLRHAELHLGFLVFTQTEPQPT